MLIHHPHPPGRQRGAVLFFAIGVLVATTLAGIALTRSVDTSNIIAGNLAFQQSAVNAADRGIEQAVAWLENKVAANPMNPPLWNNNVAEGYMALLADPATGQSWDALWTGNLLANSRIYTVPTATGTQDAAGNTVSYSIQRLCTTTGDPNALVIGGIPANPCARPPADESKGQSRAGPGSVPPPALALQIYYRVTVRVDGPRNTLSYVQALIAL